VIPKTVSIYELLGGEATFYQLAEEFYARVDRDPLLRSMFPTDLSGPKEHLALFLIQYFGGPPTYSAQRGHPRLRMRHVPFAIGRAEKEAWLGHMLAAIDALSIAEPMRTEMRTYFARSAEFMINREE
jgi:hemoglobin